MTNLTGLSDLRPADKITGNDDIDNESIGESTIISSIDNSNDSGEVKDSKDIKADKKKALAEGWEAWVAGIKARMSKDVNDGISSWIDESIKATKEHIKKLGEKKSPVEKPLETANQSGTESKPQSTEVKETTGSETKQGSSKNESKENE